MLNTPRFPPNHVVSRQCKTYLWAINNIVSGVGEVGGGGGAGEDEIQKNRSIKPYKGESVPKLL